MIEYVCVCCGKDCESELPLAEHAEYGLCRECFAKDDPLDGPEPKGVSMCREMNDLWYEDREGEAHECPRCGRLYAYPENADRCPCEPAQARCELCSELLPEPGLTLCANCQDWVETEAEKAHAQVVAQCLACGGHGRDPMSDNCNWLPCGMCHGKGTVTPARHS
jgi:hypothetical protein